MEWQSEVALKCRGGVEKKVNRLEADNESVALLSNFLPTTAPLHLKGKVRSADVATFVINTHAPRQFVLCARGRESSHRF